MSASASSTPLTLEVRNLRTHFFTRDGVLPAVDDVSVFPNFLAMPEEGGAHVVLLDDRRLLMSADCPQSAALLRARGYETVEVDISEYVKLEGCVTCLSVRLRDAPGA